MGLFEIVIIGISLAMDAFTVALCKGLAIKKFDFRKIVIISMYFAFFQALMPLIGYFLGNSFSYYIKNVDHWVCFSLLSIIGINMIRDGYSSSDNIDDMVNFKSMLFLSIATSIDALAVGITFSLFKLSILKTILIIGIITFILSSIGVFIGIVFGDKFNNKSELIGGIILIIIGLKILTEHLAIF